MNIPKTAADAFTYVNSRYTFTNDHYPMLKKLEGDERISFALTHTLLHLEKSIHQLRRRETAGLRPEYDATYRMYLVKVITNIIKLADIIGFDAEGFAALKSQRSEYSISRIVENMMQEIATDCERFDHGNPLRIEMIKHSVQIAWEYVLGDTKTFETIQGAFTITDAFTYIPQFMASGDSGTYSGATS